MNDERVCPICRDLEGYTWEFEIGKDTMDGTLWHPLHGEVWNVNIGSLAHGHRGFCRCHLTYEADMNSIIVIARNLRDRLQRVYNELVTAEEEGRRL